MKLHSRLCAAALCALGALSPGAAQAQGAQRPDAPLDGERQIAKAREAFRRGAAMAAEGRWRDALAAFEESASLRSHAKTTYNLGYCERAIGRPTRALRFFALALEEDEARGGLELTAELRAAIATFVRELEPQVAYAVVTLDPELSIAVDGGPLEVISRRGAPPLLASGTRAHGPGEAPPAPRFEVRLDPGSHLFVITHADGRNRVIERRFAASAREPLHLALERAADAPRRRATGADAASAGQPPRPSTLSARRIGVFGLAGAGVLSLAAGTFFGLQAAGTWSDAEEACPGLSACPDDRGNELSYDARRQANLATAAFVVGGAAVVGVAVLLITAPRTPEVAFRSAAVFRAGALTF